MNKMTMGAACAMALAGCVSTNEKPVWVMCRFDLKPETSRTEYIAKTRAIIDTVRAEKGCCEYRLLGDAVTDWEKPQRFGDRTLWMLEKWESIEALKAHLETPHMKAFGPTVRPMRANGTFHVLEDVAGVKYPFDDREVVRNFTGAPCGRERT